MSLLAPVLTHNLPPSMISLMSFVSDFFWASKRGLKTLVRSCHMDQHTRMATERNPLDWVEEDLVGVDLHDLVKRIKSPIITLIRVTV
jgi:hypothetical protein